jgi:hypothetical protein
MKTVKRSQPDAVTCCPTCGPATNSAPLATACTLRPEGLEGRLAEIRDIARRVLLRSERNGLILLDYRASAAGEVNALIARESECCGFLTFHVEKDGDRLRVVVAALRHTETAAQELFDAFEGRTPEASQ